MSHRSAGTHGEINMQGIHWMPAQTVETNRGWPVGILWGEEDVKDEGAHGIGCVIRAQDECPACAHVLTLTML